MKKFKLEGKETLTKKQMKKITGGYNCRTGPTVYVCQDYTGLHAFPCYDDCFVSEGNDACGNQGMAFVECGCAADWGIYM